MNKNAFKVFYDSITQSLCELVDRAEDAEQFFRAKTLNSDGKPHHIPAEILELPLETIVFLPGSPGRAKAIAEHCFDTVEGIFPNIERAFHIYYGQIKEGDTAIPVAAMPSHMGFGSLEIAVHELVACGIKTIIRVGTSGTMRDSFLSGQQIHAGDVVISRSASFGILDALAHQSVPLQRIPAHREVYEAMVAAGRSIPGVHAGDTYSKLLLYQQEFLLGSNISAGYNALMKALCAARGIVNSDMEAAELFLISKNLSNLLCRDIRAGAYCLVVGEIRNGVEIGYVEKERLEEGMQRIYALTRATARELYRGDSHAVE